MRMIFHYFLKPCLVFDIISEYVPREKKIARSSDIMYELPEWLRWDGQDWVNMLPLLVAMIWHQAESLRNALVFAKTVNSISYPILDTFTNTYSLKLS